MKYQTPRKSGINVTVITPVYNGEKYLSDCLNSVSKLTTNGEFFIEHLVINDGSIDKTQEILNGYNNSFLRVFTLPHNTGISAARNFGIAKTNADYIFCLDSDNVIFQNSLISLYAFAIKNKYDWVYGDFVRGDENLKYLPGQDYYGYQFTHPGDLLTSIFSGEHFFQGNCLFTKKLFDTVGGYNPKLKIAEDLDLFIRFAIAGITPQYIPGPLYIHRYHSRNISKVYFRENNPIYNKKDIKLLYLKYEPMVTKIVNPAQDKKIKLFLQD